MLALVFWRLFGTLCRLDSHSPAMTRHMKKRQLLCIPSHCCTCVSGPLKRTCASCIGIDPLRESNLQGVKPSSGNRTCREWILRGPGIELLTIGHLNWECCPCPPMLSTYLTTCLSNDLFKRSLFEPLNLLPSLTPCPSLQAGAAVMLA